jgi:spore maturation protein CgeB
MPTPAKEPILLKPKRVAIFAEDDHMYINQALGLKRGFEELGVEVHVGWPYLNGRSLSCFADNYQPDFILEIDRFPSQIENYDTSIKHVAWIHNHAVNGRRVLDNASGSFAVYTAILLKVYATEDFNGGNYRFLPTATDPSVFVDDETPEMFDFSFIGHMYEPVSDDILNIPIRLNGNHIMTMNDMIETFIKAGFHHFNVANTEIYAFLVDIFRHYNPHFSVQDLPDDFKTFFDERLIRTISRKQVMDILLSISSNMAIYGGPGWQKWPDYVPYYYGSINRARELGQVFRSSRVNIHVSPVTMHNRVLDVMCCGKGLLINRSRWDDEITSAQHHFTPGEDYIPYDLDDLEEVAARALRDQDWCRRIGRNARRRILEGHTWRHRAAFIIDDLAQR